MVSYDPWGPQTVKSTHVVELIKEKSKFPLCKVLREIFGYTRVVAR